MVGESHESARHYTEFAPKGNQRTLVNILN